MRKLAFGLLVAAVAWVSTGHAQQGTEARSFVLLAQGPEEEFPPDGEVDESWEPDSEAAQDEAPVEFDESQPAEPEEFVDDTQGQPEGAPESAAAVPPAAPAGPSADEVRQGMLDAHARVRGEVGVPPVVWSDTVAALAQEWTEQARANGCQLSHRPGDSRRGYGENIWWTGGPSTAAEIVQAWAAERKDYDPATNNCAADGVCGHYTQVVWRGSTEVGCGLSICSDQTYLWVCDYNPPGNVAGQRPY